MSDSHQSRKAIIKALGVFFAWFVYKTNRPKPDASGTAPSEQ